METKNVKGRHTPGPWILGKIFTKQVRAMIDPTGQTSFINIDPQHGGNGVSAICQVIGPDREANARLIAAAPELLEVVKTLRAEIVTHNQKQKSAIDFVDASIHRADEAIARAEGGK